MNVLSLFDGISCAQVALKRLGLTVDNYFASEVNPYVMSITKRHFPDTHFVGDVSQLKATDLPKIDLLIGGSPCQGFSYAGRQLNFNDDRSKLFFEYERLKNELKPTYFLLENVVMKDHFIEIISQRMGVAAFKINSALVSGQNRNRLYWTNLAVSQPDNKEIKLVDVLQEPEETISFRHTAKALDYMNRKTRDGRNHWDFNHHSDARQDKSKALVANLFKGVPYNVVLDQAGVARKFTPVECERLQTLEDDYTAGISNTQRYKALGNAFTVDVIQHLLEPIRDDKYAEEFWNEYYGNYPSAGDSVHSITA